MAVDDTSWGDTIHITFRPQAVAAFDSGDGW